MERCWSSQHLCWINCHVRPVRSHTKTFWVFDVSVGKKIHQQCICAFIHGHAHILLNRGDVVNPTSAKSWGWLGWLVHEALQVQWSPTMGFHKEGAWYGAMIPFPSLLNEQSYVLKPTIFGCKKIGCNTTDLFWIIPFWKWFMKTSSYDQVMPKIPSSIDY